MAHFPDIEEKLREEMENAAQVGETRSRLAAETAEKAQLITALLPAAQDAASYDLNEMLNRYKEVILLNEELLTGCHVRRATQEQAVNSLKNLHIILRQAARLRVGKYSKAVVAACRKAVQDNNTDALIKILQAGNC
ncbi:Bardet-Biedl syndrome 2 protein [Papilio xuthus]|nr:Bardet-Biedl syndrome 2 protein [Papilio xuthus]